MRQEELKWKQRSKDKEIKEGDLNTRYFHAKANGRQRKNRIISLEQDEGVIEGETALNEYITNYYKGLFGHPDVSNINININISNASRINNEEAENLQIGRAHV